LPEGFKTAESDVNVTKTWYVHNALSSRNRKCLLDIFMLYPQKQPSRPLTRKKNNTVIGNAQTNAICPLATHFFLKILLT